VQVDLAGIPLEAIALVAVSILALLLWPDR
jgi:hypothetical protein